MLEFEPNSFAFACSRKYVHDLTACTISFAYDHTDCVEANRTV